MKTNVESEIAKLLIGRSITAADPENNTLTLNDGTVLEVTGNEGCGGCETGWYEITHLATFPNTITSIQQVEEDGESTIGKVRLFVYSEGNQAEVITSEGWDNGYYGTGYWITTTPKEVGA